MSQDGEGSFEDENSDEMEDNGLYNDLDRIAEGVNGETCMTESEEEREDAHGRGSVDAIMTAAQRFFDLKFASVEHLISFLSDARTGDVTGKTDFSYGNARCEGDGVEQVRYERELIVARSELRRKEAEIGVLELRNAELTKREKEYSSTITALQKHNKRLSGQIGDWESRNNGLSNKMRMTENELEAAVNDATRANDMVRSNKLQITELKEKYDMAVTQFKAAKLSYTQSKRAVDEADNTIKRMTESISLFEYELTKQQQDMKYIANDRSRLVTIIQRQSQVIEAIDAALSRMIQVCNDQNTEIQAQSEDLRIQKRVKVDSTPVQITLWPINCFPEELRHSISHVTSDPSSAMQSKIESVFKIVAKHHGEQTEKLQVMVSKSNDAKSETENRIAVILSDIRRVIFHHCLKPSEDIQCDNVADLLDQLINDMKERIADFEAENSNLTNDLDSMCSKLKTASVSESLEVIETLKSCVKKMRKKIVSGNTNRRKQKNDIMKLRVAHQKEVEEYRKIETRLRKQATTLRLEKGDLLLIIDEERKAHQLLKSKLEQAEANVHVSATDFANEQRQAVRQFQTEARKCHDAFQLEISVKDAKISELVSIVEKLRRTLGQLNRKLDAVETLNGDLESQTQQTISENENRLNNWKAKAEERLECVRVEYENTISRIRAQNSELHLLVQKFHENLNESDGRNRALNADNADLIAEKRRLVAQIDAFADEQTREKALQSAKDDAIRMTEAAQKQLNREQFLSQLETEKRKIHTFAANCFAQLFDPDKKLDDASFRELIVAASAELKRHQEHDAALRRLLGLGDEECCEIAVSKMMLSLYHHPL